MTFRLDELKAQLTKGFGPARSNQYRVFFPRLVTVTAANGIEATGQDTAEGISVLCDSVALPGRQILTSERFTDMKARKVAYGFAAEDVAISFILMNDWSVWDYLNNWHRSVIGNLNGLGGYTVGFKEEYSKTIEIEHLNNNSEGKEQINKRIVLENAYPTTLNEIELGNGNENEILRVSASFSYDNWTEID